MRRVLLVLAVMLGAAGCAGGVEATDRSAPEAPPAVEQRVTPLPATAAPGPTAVGKAVPAGALLAPADLGPGWAAGTGVALPCPARTSGPARTATLRHADGNLTETVTTGQDVTAAVASWRRTLTACGYTVADDALGDAGLSARSRSGSDSVFVTGTEGVVVVLHAHGALAQSADDVSSWADMALGTSCVAAPDGCH